MTLMTPKTTKAVPNYETLEDRDARHRAFCERADAAMRGEDCVYRPRSGTRTGSFVTGPHGGLPFDPMRRGSHRPAMLHPDDFERFDAAEFAQRYAGIDPRALEYFRERAQRERDRLSHERFAHTVASYSARGPSTFRIAIPPPLPSFAEIEMQAADALPDVQTYTIDLYHIRRYAELMVADGAPDRDAWLRATYNAWKQAREAGAWE